MLYREYKKGKEPSVLLGIPESWLDVTYGNWQSIVNNPKLSDNESIARLIGCDASILEEGCMLDFYLWLGEKMNFALSAIVQEPKQEVFLINGKPWAITENIIKKSIGAYTDVLLEFEKSKGVDNLAYPFVLGAYYCIDVDGSYDYEKSKEYSNIFLDQPSVKVINSVGFFLSKVNAWRNGTKADLRKTTTRTTKSWLVTKGLVKFLASSCYYLHSVVATLRKKKD